MRSPAAVARALRARGQLAASFRPRGERSAAVEVLAQLGAPSGGDPEPVPLVVDRHHPHGPPRCEEHVKAVETADVEDAHPGEVLG